MYKHRLLPHLCLRITILKVACSLPSSTTANDRAPIKSISPVAANPGSLPGHNVKWDIANFLGRQLTTEQIAEVIDNVFIP